MPSAPTAPPRPLSGAAPRAARGGNRRPTGAVEGLRRFATTGLIAVALPERRGYPEPNGEWNVTGPLRLAREIEQALSADPDEDARWQRLQRASDRRARGARRRAAPPRQQRGGVDSARRGSSSRSRSAGTRPACPTLAAALAEEVEERQRLLDAREREILENHLVGEVAGTLQELITAGEQRVGDT